MPILPAAIPLWGYLAAGAAAFVVGKAATHGAGTDTPDPGASVNAAGVPAASTDDPYAAGGGLWDAFDGGNPSGVTPLGGQFGYLPGVGPSGDYSGLQDYLDSYFGSLGGDSGGDIGGTDTTPVPTPTPTPTPTPAPAPAPTATVPTVHVKAGTYTLYATKKVGTQLRACSTGSSIKTGGFSASCSVHSYVQCDGTGTTTMVLVTSGVYTGKMIYKGAAGVSVA